MRVIPDDKTVFPIKVAGFLRGWFARTEPAGLSTTFLGCIENQNSHVNGVIYEVTSRELSITDKWEKRYTRVKIPIANVEDYSGKIDMASNIWIYINSFPDTDSLKASLPSNEFPIVQSYVDICINGCLETESQFPKAKEDGFTVDFIQSTQYWSKYWVNDRIYPRRPFIYRPNAYQIDQLLIDNLPDKRLFEQIYFE